MRKTMLYYNSYYVSMTTGYLDNHVRVYNIYKDIKWATWMLNLSSFGQNQRKKNETKPFDHLEGDSSFC